MSTPPITELNDRARDIFRAVVEGYLETGQPVGSRTLASAGAFQLSPASIRNVMHELEALGLLAAPHTSAGRLPTDIGLRLFVDGMMRAAEPTAEERAAIEGRAVRVGPVEDAFQRSALRGLLQRGVQRMLDVGRAVDQRAVEIEGNGPDEAQRFLHAVSSARLRWPASASSRMAAIAPA